MTKFVPVACAMDALTATALFVAVLLAGCTSWQQPVSMPLELTEAGVQARLGLAVAPHVHLAATAAGGCP